MSEEKIYCGSAKPGPEKAPHIEYKILIGKKDAENILARCDENEGFCWVNFCRRREVSEKGMTHYLQIDTWKPNGHVSVKRDAPVEEVEVLDDDNIPF